MIYFIVATFFFIIFLFVGIASLFQGYTLSFAFGSTMWGAYFFYMLLQSTRQKSARFRWGVAWPNHFLVLLTLSFLGALGTVHGDPSWGGDGRFMIVVGYALLGVLLSVWFRFLVLAMRRLKGIR